MADEIELMQGLLALHESISEIYSMLSEQNKTLQTILTGMEALVLTGAELDPRFHDAYNRLYEQAEKSSKIPVSPASRKQQIEAHLAALKKRGGGKIQ
jgi:hypothetical protein